MSPRAHPCRPPSRPVLVEAARGRARVERRVPDGGPGATWSCSCGTTWVIEGVGADPLAWAWARRA